MLKANHRSIDLYRKEVQPKVKWFLIASTAKLDNAYGNRLMAHDCMFKKIALPHIFAL